MLERLFEEGEPLGAALATLSTVLTLFTSEDNQVMHLDVLRSLHQAIVLILCRNGCGQTNVMFPLARLASVGGQFHERVTRLRRSHFSTSFVEGPSKPKQVGCCDAVMSRALSVSDFLTKGENNSRQNRVKTQPYKPYNFFFLQFLLRIYWSKTRRLVEADDILSVHHQMHCGSMPQSDEPRGSFMRLQLPIPTFCSQWH